MSFAKKISTRALYIQVRDHLAQQIAEGTLKPGFHLPSELEFADLLGVSLGTVRKALEALESERLITRRQGRGTFVRDHAADARLTFDNLRKKDGQSIPFTVQFSVPRVNAPMRRNRSGSDWKRLSWLLDVDWFATMWALICSSGCPSRFRGSLASIARN